MKEDDFNLIYYNTIKEFTKEHPEYNVLLTPSNIWKWLNWNTLPKDAYCLPKEGILFIQLGNTVFFEKI